VLAAVILLRGKPRVLRGNRCFFAGQASTGGEQHEAGMMPALEKMQRGGRMTAPSE
jgi:hypothetical protein